MPSEIETRAKFDLIRYAQAWEDADLLLESMGVTENDTVLSIASAGDNAFAILAQNPVKVYAVDLSFSQIACCELRKAMYRYLEWREHLFFGGVVCGETDRLQIFRNKLKRNLPDEIQEYWEHNLAIIEGGFMTLGKFERYFTLFRKRVLPLIHSKKTLRNLIAPKREEERIEFYKTAWDNRRWRAVFKLFFSRFVMGRFGRDKEFFKFVEGDVANRILSRCTHALTILDPSQNPYLHFIMYGQYTNVFPYALREENYEKIKRNLDKIEFRKQSIEEFAKYYNGKINAANLSDIFEYMTQDGMDALYELLLQKTALGARLAYWNMLTPRSCSDALRAKYGVKTSMTQNEVFLLKDKTFFYSKFYLDTISQ